eukprot:11329868-Ditylum_brightwellii.AAC.1
MLTKQKKGGKSGKYNMVQRWQLSKINKGKQAEICTKSKNCTSQLKEMDQEKRMGTTVSKMIP